jgi:alpha-ribazole phosphatase
MSVKAHTVTRIDIIRHGEPQGGEVFRGRVDHELTSLGRWQFEQRIQRFASPWSRIISSPLQRCHSSAKQLSERLNLPLLVDSNWQEIHYGDWEDKLIADVMAEQIAIAQQLWQDPLNFCAPNGEPVPDLQQRVRLAWSGLLNDHKGEHLLVVSHGGVMRVLAQYLLLLDPKAMNRLAIPYAGFMRIRIDHTVAESGTEEHWYSLEALDGSELNQVINSDLSQ